MLVAADVRLGKLRYGGRVYGFSARALAAAFAADPDRRLEQVIPASCASCNKFPRFSLDSVAGVCGSVVSLYKMFRTP